MTTKQTVLINNFITDLNQSKEMVDHQKVVKIDDDKIPLEDAIETGTILSDSSNSDENIPFEVVFRKYVLSTLQQRICSLYVPSKPNSNLCGCGRLEAWHGGNDVKTNPEQTLKWNPESHTQLETADSFGEIDFCGFGSQTEPSPYVRISHTTPLSQAWSLLSNVWKLNPPSMVISVTGGAKKFEMKARLKSAFKQGLIDVAYSTGAWIITGGTKTGVMEYVGEAVQQYSCFKNSNNSEMVAIGIASWGIVKNKQCLVGQPGSGQFPAIYNLKDRNKNEVRAAPLDHNHTHFILVDNGTEGKFGGEIKFRANLEKYISTHAETNFGACGAEIETPLVVLVCEGGIGTLSQVEEAVLIEVPVVIIEGSGRAADVISIACKMVKISNSKMEYDDNFDQKMFRLVESLFNLDVDQQHLITGCVQSLRTIVTKQKFITLFNIDHDQEMDKAILQALMKAKPNAKSQINLALKWNRSDIARTDIFSQENRQMWQDLNLEEEMQHALLNDNTEFIQLFMDNGVYLGEFLTITRLRQLYTSTLDDPKGICYVLQNLIKKINFYRGVMTFGLTTNKIDAENVHPILSDISRVLMYLLRFEFEELYTESRYMLFSGDEQKLIDNARSSGTKYRAFDHPARDIFIWAILFNKQAVARMFWRLAPDPLGGALLGQRIMTSLAREAEWHEETDLGVTLMQFAEEYEQLACSVMRECYALNKTMAHDLLTRQLDPWGKITALTTAASGEMMNFMQMTCCQSKLNQIWIGNMSDYTSDWKIILAIFCPLVIPIIRFKSASKTNDKTKLTETRGRRDPSVKDVVHPDNFNERKKSAFEVQKPPCFRWKQRAKEKTVGVATAINFFYTAPVTKFFSYVLSHLIFLILFTAVVLTKFHPINEWSSWICIELFCWLWAGSSLVEEMRQLVSSDVRSYYFKIQLYIRNFWNQVDFILSVLLIVSITLRLRQDPSDTHAVKISYSLTLTLWYLRFTAHFYVSKAIGPKIVMIQKMMKDLGFFISILFVFILSFGVPMQAMLYPNEDFSFQLILNAIYTPYWQIFGELFLDRAESKTEGECSFNKTAVHLDDNLVDCPEKSVLVIILSAIYMLLTNVLLMNLLIAMFSYTFQVVQDNSEKVWRFHRFHLIQEAHDRPTLAPPLIVISHIVALVRTCKRRLHKAKDIPTSFKLYPSKAVNSKLTLFEKSGMENYLLRQNKQIVEQLENQVAEASEKIVQVYDTLDHLKEHMVSPIQIDGNNEKMPHYTEMLKKLETMETQTHRQKHYVKRILKHVRRANSDDSDSDDDKAVTKKIIQSESVIKPIQNIPFVQSTSEVMRSNFHNEATLVREGNIYSTVDKK